jgi:hypothetical protein
MEKKFELIWPLILPNEIPKDDKLEKNFLKNINNRE